MPVDREGAPSPLPSPQGAGRALRGVPVRPRSFLEKITFPSARRARLWRRIAAQCRAGVPLTTVLAHARSRALGQGVASSPAQGAPVSPRRPGIGARDAPLASRGLVSALDALLASRTHGRPLGWALAGRAGPAEIALIGAGERSGDVSRGFELAAAACERTGRFRSAIASSLAYPCLLGVLSVVMLGVVSRLLVPQLAQALPAEDWQGAGHVLWIVARTVDSPAGVGLLCLLLLAIVLGLATLPTWTGRARALVDGVGHWGIYRAVCGSSWLSTTAMLLGSGLSLREALQWTLSSPGATPWLRERVGAVARLYAEGRDIGEALELAGHRFPSRDAIEDIAVASSIGEAGAFAERLARIAEEESDQALREVRSRLSRLGLALVLLVFSLAALTVAGLSSIQQQFANMA